MSEVFRRVILKPAGLPEDKVSALGKALGEAVLAQQRLASKSPHVLQFVGSLQETEQAFYIDHEPAEILISSPELFAPATSPAEPKILLQIAVALLDSLRAVHGGAAAPLSVHGAVCPGVILKTHDGIEKVTDFSFAPAVRSALDADSYLNLAVGIPQSAVVEGTVSGQWEVLSPDEYDREDRICAFIDPQKYGTGMMESFEPGSDVIAVGIYLHLFAEHQHPYLYADPDAHRMVDMSEFMAQNLFNNARRADLRESSDPAVVLWCDLVARMLARLPQDRPSSAEALEALSAHVKPIDAGELIKRQLEKLLEDVAAGPPDDAAWKAIEQTARTIAENDSAAADVREQAAALVRRVEAKSLVQEADALLQGKDWADAKSLLDRLPDASELSPDLAATAKQCAGLHQKFSDALARLNTVRQDMDTATTAETTEALAILERCKTDLEKIDFGSSYPISIRQAGEELLAEIERRRQALLEQQAALEKEFSTARAWLEELENAGNTDAWDEYQTILAERPDVAHWPAETDSQLDALQLRFDEYRQAEAWVQKLRTAHDGGAWEEAFKIAANEPAVSHWPAQLRRDADDLCARVRQVKDAHDQEARARKWIAGLESAVQSRNWAAAGAVLDGRPDIEHWPEGLESNERQLREKIGEHIAEEEREALAIVEAKRLAASWLGEAQELAKRQEWDAAIQLLTRPPEIGHFPPEVRKEADALLASCTDKRDESVRRRHEHRIASVSKQTDDLLRQAIEGPLAGLINADLLAASVEKIEIDADGDEGFGSATLSVRFALGDGGRAPAAILIPFQFDIQGDATTIAAAEPSTGQALASALQDSLREMQQAGLAEMVQPLRAGLFPKAELEANITEPTKQAKVSFKLAADAIETRAVATKLQWNPQALAWQFADTTKIVKAIHDIVLEAAGDTLPAAPFEQSKQLATYKDRITCAVAVQPPAESAPIPAKVTLRADLTLRADDSADPTALGTIDFTCEKLGEFTLASGLAEADKSLAEAVLAKQLAASQRLRTELAERIASAPVKVRLDMRPKQLTEPVESLQFGMKCLTCKKRPVATLIATWDAAAFDLTPTKDWDDDLDALLATPTKAETGAPVALIAGGALAIAVLAAVGVSMMKKAPPTVSTPPTGDQRVVDARSSNDDESGEAFNNTPDDPGTEGEDVEQPVIDTQPVEGQTTAKPPDILAVQRIRESIEALLRGSPFLRPIIDDPNRADQLLHLGDDAKIPGFVVEFPGLDRGTITIALSGDDVPADSIRAIASNVSELDAILSLRDSQLANDALYQAIQEEAVDANWTRSMDAELLQAELVAPQDGAANFWLLQDGTWRSVNAKSNLRVNTPSGEPVLAGTIDVTLAVAAGRITVASPEGAIGKQVKARLQPVLSGLQRDSAGALTEQLKASSGLAAIAATVSTEPGDDAAFRDELILSIDAPDLRTRTVSAQWNPSTLAYEPDLDWAATLARVTLAAEVLAELNRTLPPDHWIRKATTANLFELEAPGARYWTLAAQAPWAAADAAKALDRKEKLPLRVSKAPLDTGGSSGDIAQQIIANELAKPSYWPLVEEFANYNNGGQDVDRFFLAGERASEWRSAADSLQSDDPVAVGVFKSDVVLHWRSSQSSVIRPAMDFVSGSIAIVSSDGGPEELTLGFNASWAIATDSPNVPGSLDQMGLAAVQQSLSEKFGPPLPCLVSVRIGGDGAVNREWSGIESSVKQFADTFAHVQALDNELSMLDGRVALERQFEQLLPAAIGGGGTATVVLEQADAFGRLVAIWQIKGTPKVGQDLPSLAAEIRKTLKGRLARNKRAQAQPSVFAEYFRGPKNTYAIAWSMDDKDQIAEGPTLLRLCRSADLMANAAGIDLGQALLGAVLDTVPTALTRAFPAQPKLGLLLAPDEFGDLGSFSALRFPSRQSRLIHMETGLEDSQLSWQSLDDLTKGSLKDWACAYRLCHSLATVNRKWPRIRKTPEALPWSLQTIGAAMSGGG